ncbi:TPT-domain-containing protein [Aureobasidium sp. EXF-10727]|nr:TPT-domain-containing protein [Aureobasidium sp. EXF-10727]
MGNHNYERAPFSEHSDDENVRPSLDNHEAKLDIDLEDQKHEKPERPSSSLMVWIAINVLATIGIVFTNKRIFSDPSLRGAQLSFACFHFFVTFATLHVVSSPRFGYFARRKTTMREVLPLGAAMCFNVVLPNLSLAFSSVMFYQTSRILLTPVTAVLNYAFYGKTIAKQAAYTLIPVCLGVGIVSYYDTKPGANTQSTSFMGVVFAMTGVVASSIYTVWIGYFHKKLELTSHQLLHNQSLCGAVMLLYFIPFIDSFPVWSEVPISRWILILFSGLCASAINLSQFVIIDGAGPVASTVVGHSKTLSIVALGWVTSGHGANDKSLFGIVIAVGGIVLYSVATTLFK